MSIGYSSIELIGYLGQDPRPIQSGDQVNGARFSIAVNRVWTDESGQRRETTEWFNVVAWNVLAENCLNYLSKGSLVFVVGKPRTQQWTDQQGGQREQVQVLAHKVVFLNRPEAEADQEK
jgi:single-strand DNA-binding protein